MSVNVGRSPGSASAATCRPTTQENPQAFLIVYSFEPLSGDRWRSRRPGGVEVDQETVGRYLPRRPTAEGWSARELARRAHGHQTFERPAAAAVGGTCAGRHCLGVLGQKNLDPAAAAARPQGAIKDENWHFAAPQRASI